MGIPGPCAVCRLGAPAAISYGGLSSAADARHPSRTLRSQGGGQSGRRLSTAGTNKIVRLERAGRSNAGIRRLVQCRRKTVRKYVKWPRGHGLPACTPARVYFGWSGATRARRALGLYSFVLAAVHFAIVVGLHYGSDLGLIRADGLAAKPYIVVGAAALAVLVPLAATSSNGWMMRLGRRWMPLHLLLYVAAVLAAVHYLWLVKAITAGPVLIAAAIAGLLVLRASPMRRLLSHGGGARSDWHRPRAARSSLASADGVTTIVVTFGSDAWRTQLRTSASAS